MLPPEVVARLDIASRLRKQGDAISIVAADLMDFHRREQKPLWGRVFDRAAATPEERRDDPGCVEGVQVNGAPATVKKSVVQPYHFDPSKECKLGQDDKVRFTHNLDSHCSHIRDHFKSKEPVCIYSGKRACDGEN